MTSVVLANPYSSAVLSDNELHEHLISIHRMSHGVFSLVTVSLHYLETRCVGMWIIMPYYIIHSIIIASHEEVVMKFYSEKTENDSIATQVVPARDHWSV